MSLYFIFITFLIHSQEFQQIIEIVWKCIAPIDMNRFVVVFKFDIYNGPPVKTTHEKNDVNQ